jgi:hypothetical protein
MKSSLSKLSKKINFAQARVLNKTTRGERDAQRSHSIDERLMMARRWAYLRYLHTREALLLTEDVESVLVIGSGRGYAELNLALEFPRIHFHLTDIESEKTPYYQNAQKIVEMWGMDNVTFGIRDILVPEPGRYDLVWSVEVLEHIKDDALAAAEMRAAANKYVFLLVPFGDKAANRDEERRARTWEAHGHYVVGYDEEDLRKLFPDIITMRGCYWMKIGVQHRKRLYSMSNEEIKANMSELRQEARRDIVDDIPYADGQAKAIWMLARV